MGSNCLCCSPLSCITSYCCRLIGKFMNSWRAVTSEVVSEIIPISAWKYIFFPFSELLVSSASKNPSTAVCCISRCSCLGPSSFTSANKDCLKALSVLSFKTSTRTKFLFTLNVFPSCRRAVLREKLPIAPLLGHLPVLRDNHF